MSKIKKALLIFAALIFVNISLVGINILQKGIGGYDGRSIAEILKVDPAKATIDDIKKLDKSDVFQLFYASPPPSFKSMKGEYRAETLPVGIMSPFADFFTHHFFGPGHWEGKAFFPFKEKEGWGYNLFKNGNKEELVRTRKMRTYVGTSTIDDKQSFHLDYSPFNDGMVYSMHDEIRMVNEKLYICMGHMASGGGAINPAPFVLYGAPSQWKGPDKE